MSNLKSVLVFGATGSCGHAVIERGLSRGFNVTAYVRNEAKARKLFGSDDSKLSIVVGELTDSKKSLSF